MVWLAAVIAPATGGRLGVDGRGTRVRTPPPTPCAVYIGHTRATLARARAHAEMQVAAMHAGPAQGIRWEDFYAYQHYAQAGAARVARGW